MASTSDIRDILNLGSGPRPPAPKKKKRVEPLLPRMTGVSREVQALMGDSVPPIAIVEHKAYKSKPSISQKLFKVRHWEERPFVHGAREDGLVLKHWKRSIPRPTRPTPAAAAAATTTSTATTMTTTTPADVEMTDGINETVQQTTADDNTAEIQFEDEFPSSKWNVKVPIDRYTDQQYEDNFKSDDWSKKETDYLIQLCVDFDLRWILIADRYDPSQIPATDENGQQRHYPDRTMEQLKSRYYTIAARLMEIRTPASNMTATEFQLWEKMRNFDAKTEKVRKEMADKLFERTKDEAEEERILLEELHRITKNEEDFIKLRRELYSRLESVQPMRRTERGEEQSTAMYQTSGGLSMLLQSLLAKERKLKRPQPASGGTNTPAEPKRSQPNQYTRRETADSAADDSATKKGSSAAQPALRTLTPAEEAKYGVSHPKDRLTSGVHFRHEKINRLTMAKSQVQTSKIQAALAELAIPPRLLMPTEKVCREFERLVSNIHLLLEARKVSEKVKAEIQVLQEARRIRLGLPKDADPAAVASSTAASQDPTKAETSKHVQGNAEGQGPSAAAVDDNKEEANENNKDKQESKGEADKGEAGNDSTHLDEGEDEAEGAPTTGQASTRGDEDEEQDEEEEDDDDNNAATATATTLGQDNEDNDEGEEEEEEEEDDDNDDEEAGGSGADAEVAEASDAADSNSDNDNDNEQENASNAQSDNDEEDNEEDEDNEDEDEEQSRPASSHSAANAAANATAATPAVATASSNSSATRGRKRSASVLSASSKAGSSRSAAVARKRRK